ncbi:PAS domain S-box protein [Saccharopolyspora aridisoli]|uniref:PAS domain S-box protein n=1 Tax=Saccharopolyspora aridisoli TaxID=2530385 RepID=A0A4R4UKM4_9PSEU|nr:PAS domain S-box protein [Saccharopolyspora aridisoli]TDC92190.1 PAS domain S-box protein [Saccharopolyspora aridisoli]
MGVGARSTRGTALWDALWSQVSGPIALLDLQGRHVDVNPAMCRLLGYDRETLLELLPADVTHMDDYVLTETAVQNIVREQIESFSAEKRLLRSDGSVILVLVNSSLIRAQDGSPELIVSQFHDITARHESELLWRQTLINAPIGIALTSLDGRCTEANVRLCELVGYRREQLVGQRCTDLIYNGDKEPVDALYAEFRDGCTDSASLEICMRHRDGHPFWILARLGLIRGLDDRPAYVVGQYEPLGDDAQVEEGRLAELTRMALHDPLTGVANRALLIDRYQQEIAKFPVQEGVLALLLVDLDGFKEINDRYGHVAGDEILQAAARELLGAVRTADTVARVGGDEFVVLASVADQAQAEELRTRVDRRLNTEPTAPDLGIRSGASVGMAFTRSPSTPYRVLLDSADQDMYARKNRSSERA